MIAALASSTHEETLVMARLNENSIRDYLMQRLDLVEPGLVPVAREHYLKNYEGASGFLDILARDSSSRLVIIELKRTDAAAREALQELCKYAALLRRNYLVRNVDYRLIVLAVEWHELLVPYSEFVKQVSYEVSAGKIILDDEGLPLRIEPVTPVPTASQRKFAKRHFLWHFQSEEYANSAADKLAAHMDKVGLRDFVLVKTRSTDPRISDKSFLYFAQQELTLPEYQFLIRKQLGDEEYGEYLDCISDLIEEEDRVGESADQVGSLGMTFSMAHLIVKHLRSRTLKRLSIGSPKELKGISMYLGMDALGPRKSLTKR